MNKKIFAATVLGFGLTLAPAAIHAQATDNTPAVTDPTPNNPNMPRVSRDLLTSTVHEAWINSGRDEDKFFDAVKQLADLSAFKRGVTLPDDEATGKRLGELIKDKARKDPDQLLYAVVDAAVREAAAGFPPKQHPHKS